MAILRCLLLALVALCPLAALDNNRDPQKGAWAMRYRTAVDPVAGWAMRYPYTWRMQDQYKAEWMPGWGEDIGGGKDQDAGEVIIVGGRKMVVGGASRPSGPVLRAFSAEDAASELDAVGDKEAGAKLTWGAYDYYGSTTTRPHGDSAWALEGIVAKLGTSPKDDLACLVVRHGGRTSGIVVRLPYDHPARTPIIDSFEILSTGTKTKPGAKPNPKDKDARAMTWREQIWRKKSGVLDPAGKPVSTTGKPKEPAWSGAWEIETEHYHVTAHGAPARLAWHGHYLEALYRAYAGLFKPEVMPPVKFEVHIFNTYQQFNDASAAWGFPNTAGPGSIRGGFFVPSLMSIWLYEESGKLGGADFTVEHVAAHECSHQFLHLACNGSDHVPTWINEGIAVYFENGVFKNGEFQMRPPSERISLLKSQYSQSKNTLWPMENYIGHGGGISASMYGEVYAMVHFWVFGAKGGQERFIRYWNELKKGVDGQKAFEEIFMADMIKAKGSREAAIAAWQTAMFEYVTKALK